MQKNIGGRFPIEIKTQIRKVNSVKIVYPTIYLISISKLVKYKNLPKRIS